MYGGFIVSSETKGPLIFKKSLAIMRFWQIQVRYILQSVS